MKKKDLENANKEGDLVPYYLDGKNTPSLYNDVRVPNSYDTPDKFKPTAKSFSITGLPKE
jgi:hypothetical protein